MPPRKGFTLIELLVVIAIIAVLAVVVVLSLNPAQLLAQSRDANRVSDLATLSSAIGLYQTDVAGGSLGSSTVIYTSLPSPSSTCDLGLLTPASPYTYHCSSNGNYRNINATGWIPLDFSTIASGAPFGFLPVDPTNTSSSRLYYTYTTNGSQYELTAPMESRRYQLGGAGDVIASDGAPLATVYAKGTNLTLEPLDYGATDLIAYWPLNGGSGTIAYDDSGNGNNATWQGTPAGANGTYYTSAKQGQVGYFNGTNDQLTASINLGSQANTIAGWFNGLSSSTIWIMCKSPDYGSYANGGFDIAWNGGINFRVGASPVDHGYSPTYPDGTWHFFAWTFDGTNLNFYMNGQRMETWPYGYYLGSGTSTLTVGACNVFFPGMMYGMRIYDTALTASQVQSLYAVGQ